MMISLLNFPGLNCYTASLVSAAAMGGVRYADAFVSLWSETGMVFDPLRKGWVSVRLVRNLAALGGRLEELASADAEQSARSLGEAAPGETLIVGMDSYFVPWSPYYRLFNGPHCFIAQPSSTGELICHDPVYRKSGTVISAELLAEHNNGLARFFVEPAGGIGADAAGEARAAARLSETPWPVEKLGLDKPLSPRELDTASKYIDCMINNRLLFRRHIEQRFPKALKGNPLGGEGLFEQWTAVKMGLQKASVLRKNAQVLEETRGLIAGACAVELEAALALSSSV